MEDDLPNIGIGFAGVPLRDTLALAREADRAGIHFTSAGDGIGQDSFSLLAAIAAVTTNLRLISGIATWTRTPLTTARSCRSLDMLSGGRYTFGMGSMPRVWSEDHHGVPAGAPLSRMREFIELVRLLWASGPDAPVDYEGRFYRVHGYRAPEPPPRPHLPVLIGVSRRRMIVEAGEWADGAYFNWNFAAPWLREHGLPALEEGAKRSGRSLEDLERRVFGFVFVAQDREQAERARYAVRYHLATTYMSFDYHKDLLTSFGFGDEVAAASASLERGDPSGAARAVSDRMVEAYSMIGTAEECRQRMSEYAPLLTGYLMYAPTHGFSVQERIDAIRRLIQAFGEGA